MMEHLRGRFGERADRKLMEFLSSAGTDKEMILEDIWGTEAHVLMLSKQGIISKKDAAKILNALDDIKDKSLNGKFFLNPELEDVHMNIESYVIKKVGKNSGGLMHIARSRNDQVLLDTKLKLRSEILKTSQLLLNFISVLLRMAENSTEVIMPGYTHLQHAQPVTLGLWFSAYASMLSRDMERLDSLYNRINRNPLGAGALAGTSFKIDREYTTKLLGFDKVHENPLDAVSSRDHVIETLSVLSIIMSNLSRMSEDLILYSTNEFNILEIPDRFTTGSSIMPQKKNPDFAELIRGKTGFLYGSLMQILTVMKGIPLGYNRDMQEDRIMLWNSIGYVNSSLEILSEVISGLKFNEERMLELVNKNFSMATELANYLVREMHINFRSSHEIVGGIVKKLAEADKDFSNIDMVSKLLMAKGINLDKKTLGKILNPENSINLSSSLGGTSPTEVRKSIKKLKDKTSFFNKKLTERIEDIEKARKLTDKTINSICG